MDDFCYAVVELSSDKSKATTIAVLSDLFVARAFVQYLITSRLVPLGHSMRIAYRHSNGQIEEVPL